MSHVHPHLAGESLVAAAEEVLSNSGEQLTPLRAKVLAVLCGLDQPASAYDIAEALSKQEERRVAANSIYRILDIFVEANLVRRVESANAYIINAHPTCQHDCIFMICAGCGAVSHLDDDRITRSLRNAARITGFTTSRSVIELHGRCAACAAGAADRV